MKGALTREEEIEAADGAHFRRGDLNHHDITERVGREGAAQPSIFSSPNSNSASLGRSAVDAVSLRLSLITRFVLWSVSVPSVTKRHQSERPQRLMEVQTD